MAKQRNSLGIIVLDVTTDVFESGGGDDLTIDQYKEKTGIDLKSLFLYNTVDEVYQLKTCTKLILGKFSSTGREKVVTPIGLRTNTDGQLTICSTYDGSNGDFISSALVIDFVTNVVYFEEN